jgi:hypothetical protein
MEQATRWADCLRDGKLQEVDTSRPALVSGLLAR